MYNECPFNAIYPCNFMSLGTKKTCRNRTGSLIIEKNNSDPKIIMIHKSKKIIKEIRIQLEL